MDKRLLLEPIKNSTDYTQLINKIKNGETPTALYGLDETQKSHIIYGIHDEFKGQICVITYNDIEAGQIHEDLKFYAENKVLLFPTKDIIFYDMEAASHDVEVERIKTVKKIIEKENCIVVTSIEALLHQLPSPTLYTKNRINLKIGATVDLANIIETFILQGYERMDTVEERGQFSIRGDIIDIFPGSSEVPFRIELFGDEIDSIRRFEVNTQRSMDKVDFVKVYPAKEMGIKDLNVEEIISKLHRDYKSISKKLDMDAKQNLKEKFGETVEKLKELRNFKGIEKLLPYICKKPDTLLDYFDKDAIFILDDPNRLREKSKGYIDEFYQNFNVLIERGEIFPKQGELILSYNEIIERLKEHKLIVLSLLPKTIKRFSTKGIINFNTRPMQSFNGKMGFLVKEIKKLQYKGIK